MNDKHGEWYEDKETGAGYSSGIGLSSFLFNPKYFWD
jgi:hypothetical protein